MRVLVVGTVPPPGGAVAKALGNAVAQRLSDGDEVEVLSPDLRSAAHRHARLNGLYLALALVRAARRSDALILRIERNLPFAPTTGRLSRAITLLALGVALRLYHDVTIRLDTPIAIPGGLGGRAAREVWGRAGRIIAANSEDAANLRVVPGVDSDRVEVEEVAAPGPPARFEGWEVDLAGNVREQALMTIRARARRDRVALTVATSMSDANASQFVDLSSGELRALNPNLSGLARFAISRGRRVLVRMTARGRD